MAKCDNYFQHGLKFLCYGTKEMEVCSCGGDTSKCNFYPEKRKQKIVNADREKLVELLESAESSCYWNSEDKGFIQKIADHLYENGVTFVSVNNFGCKLIPYEERVKTYTNALISYGDKAQMIVAIEELSEQDEFWIVKETNSGQATVGWKIHIPQMDK